MIRRRRANRPGSPALECPGCGEEIDPRDVDRGSVTESGYCGLICAMTNSDGGGS